MERKQRCENISSWDLAVKALVMYNIPCNPKKSSALPGNTPQIPTQGGKKRNYRRFLLDLERFIKTIESGLWMVERTKTNS
jgi:hypothetical protein